MLGNFLGTYVSRYSDYRGSLLFGFLVGDLDELRIDLLGQGVGDPSSPQSTAVLLAVTKFEEQRQRARLPASRIREARLTIRQLPGLVSGSINEQPCQGFNLGFRVTALMDDDHCYERERVVFIAPYHAVPGFRPSKADG